MIGWGAAPLAAGERAEIELSYTVPSGLSAGRDVVTVEVVLDGQLLGSIVEGVLEV